MDRTLATAIVLNWLALIATAVHIVMIGDAITPAVTYLALAELGCLFVAIAMLTAIGASAALSEREEAPKVDHQLVSRRMAKVMARQSAWLADAPLLDMRKAA